MEHNVRLTGRTTGAQRQVDVLVRQPIGQYEISIAIDCKDYADPIDVKGVEEFAGSLHDLGVTKGAMVAPRGFTPAAKKVAKEKLIDLFSPVDTDPHKWQVKASLPIICDWRSVAISFGISCSAPYPFMMPADFFESVEAFDGDGKALGTSFKTALTRWNNGEYPTEPGDHERVPLFPAAETHVDNGYNLRIPVQLFVGLRVTQELYFGHLPIVKIRGLKDEFTGAVITNSFTTGVLSPEEVEKNWKLLKSESEAPVKPAARIVGLTCWEIG